MSLNVPVWIVHMSYMVVPCTLVTVKVSSFISPLWWINSWQVPVYSIFWPPQAVSIWSGPSVLPLGEPMILSNPVCNTEMTAFATIVAFSTSSWALFLPVWYLCHINCLVACHFFVFGVCCLSGLSVWFKRCLWLYVVSWLVLYQLCLSLLGVVGW